jgi:hypothetical protein
MIRPKWPLLVGITLTTAGSGLIWGQLGLGIAALAFGLVFIVGALA